MAKVKNKTTIIKAVTNGVDSTKLRDVYKEKALFTFDQFKFIPINIRGEFNNYYESETDFIAKTFTLLADALPMLSREKVEDLVTDRGKNKKFHFHQIKDKEDILKSILQTYSFPEKKIDSILHGDNIYQFAMEAQRGATRIVVERVDNIFSVLFLDTNHHIYFNKKLGTEAMMFECCPDYERNVCEPMKHMGECFAFGYLDEERIKSSYEYGYNAESNT